MYKLSGISKSQKWIEKDVKSVSEVVYYVHKLGMTQFEVDKILLNKSLMSLVLTDGITPTVNSCVKVPVALLKLL